MLESLINKITSEASSELFFLLSGSLILYILQQFYFKLKSVSYKRKVRAELSAYKKRKEAVKVVDLANGDPEFDKTNIFANEASIFGHKKCLYIGIPPKIRDEIHATEKKIGYSEAHLTRFNDDTSFNGDNNFQDLVDLTKIKNLPELIAKHKELVGKDFLESKNGLIFNGIKYGIYNLKFTRFGESEEPGVRLDLFKTDYFTHRVFRAIYHELKEADHPIAKAGVSELDQYKPFLTSFGINCLLICEGSEGKEIVLSKRSNRVHGNRVHGKRPKYHITMNEGLSQTDKDPFGKIDLELCYKRGLLEELGINEKIYQHAVKASFYDFFLEKNNFEIGLSSVFQLELDYQKDIEPLIARDKHLEVDKFVPLPLRQKEIENFVENNEFIPHGLYVLERVLLREKISIKKSIQ